MRNIDGKLYRKASTDINYPGYYVGTSEGPTGSYYIENSVMDQKEGYNNKLYYPHTLDYNNCFGYWIASPSSIIGAVLRVARDGNVYFYDPRYSGLGIRPVVSLNSGITVNAE